MLGNSLRNATLSTILLSLGAAFALAAPAPAGDKPASVAGKPVFIAKSHLVRKPR